MSASRLIFRGVFAQHLDPLRSHNDELASARINDAPGDLEFWIHQLAASEINEAEKSLIRATSPKTNRIRYTN